MTGSSVTQNNTHNVELSPHSLSVDAVLSKLGVSKHGLSHSDVTQRIERYGPNTFPKTKPPGVLSIFLTQFTSPLIYVLLAAALLSLLIQEWSDAGFIFLVLLVNAIIGSVQELSAQRSASALQELVSIYCRVLRISDDNKSDVTKSDSYEINANQLVPGDIVLLEQGDRVPADIRLLDCHDLEADESLLTGESRTVLKNAQTIFNTDIVLADRTNMAFAGSMIIRGRATGVVVTTALNTELGHIAEAVLNKPLTKPPLVLRLEKFTHGIAVVVVIAALIMAGVAYGRGTPLNEIFFLAVALAVSAIPEGLPVALTVALAIGMRRMARRNVIIRRLVAVESLGSCTFIASDKTGTLTVNQLTVSQIVSPNIAPWEVTGQGVTPIGNIISTNGELTNTERVRLKHLCLAAVLSNDGFLGHREHGWSTHGDAVDIALLVMAHKAGITKADVENEYAEQAIIPFESERLFSASLNQVGDGQFAFVKGALERLLPMCNKMLGNDGDLPIDGQLLEKQAHTLASQGYRVLALASGKIALKQGEVFSEEHLHSLTFLGLVAMIDPLRVEAKQAIIDCQKAGIKVAMVTGDHPATALAIARQLNLTDDISKVVTGGELRRANTQDAFDSITRQAHVFARVEPQQKLDIVQSLQRNGHFVAVTGDGANDAPALHAAQVGVAMGKNGTDVARESADIITTDDNFASIVSGIEEGRVAYANVRKVIFLLISTGAAELVLFTLALITAQPLPLLAVQLLWLNLVTNGIQDVALAFEPKEGDELKRPPRPTTESVFNRLMIERVIVSALVIGFVAFFLFQWLLTQGYTIEEARNGTLLLMVLFENIHVFNSRSETRSVFKHNPLRNPILLFGTAVAQLIHIGAMYTPWVSDVLHIQPVSLLNWLKLLSLALIILMVMEIHKLVRKNLANM